MVASTEITPRQEDISKMLKCNTHLGTKNCDVLMEPYVFKRRFDGKMLTSIFASSIFTQLQPNATKNCLPAHLSLVFFNLC